MKIESMDASKLNFQAGQQNIAVKSRPENKAVNLPFSERDPGEMSISEKAAMDAIEKANKAISGVYRRFEFSIHEVTKQIMVKVIDVETNEVVREIPPEKILDLIAKIWEMAGLIVDERR